MKWGKIVLATVVVGVLANVWAWLTCGWLFNWVYSLMPTEVWKPVEQMPLMLMNVANFIAAFLLVLVYAIIYKGIPGKGAVRGLLFGLFLWLACSLPGNFMLGLFTVINPTVIGYWIISFLVFGLLEGAVIALIYGD
ncbi:MAG: hypothetical protein JSV34_00125 [Candidatus Omnitrophota bacterium]|nr:MAG: hypothetical protein JSV34_00125 [Candidatus Omnitrophota bacterium]